MRRRSTPSLPDNDDSFRRSNSSIASNHGLTLESSTSSKQTAVVSALHLLGIFVLCAIPWIPSFTIDQRMESVREEAGRLQSESEVQLKGISSAIDNRRQLKNRVTKLERLNNRLLKILKVQGDMVDPENNLYQKAEREEQLYIDRIDSIETSVQNLDRITLQEKYGQGHLRFQISLSNDSRLKIEIETLPMNFIPHALSVFSEIVENGFFDNATISQDIGGCLHFHPMEDKVSKTPIFVENPVTKSMDGMKVLLGKRGLQSAVFFCAEDTDHDAHGLELESVFAFVVSGADFLKSLRKSSSESTQISWRVQSIARIEPEKLENSGMV